MQNPLRHEKFSQRTGMATTTDDLLSKLDAIGEKAQQALTGRPSFSIRRRLALGFLLWFVLSLAITVVSIITISQIKNKLYFTEATNNYTFEIQQARRFEKNYFLYHTNLGDALDHAYNAAKILEDEKTNIISVAGAANFRAMTGHIERYEELLTQLQKIEGDTSPSALAEFSSIEAELREHGSEMVKVAKDLVAKERKAVNSMLLISQRIPIAFLLLLIFLNIYLAIFIARQMMAPLNRMMNATRRIASGDFTPIMPKRKYHDEFSELALSMNHMMLQLAHRHDLLLKAHKLKAVGTLTAGVAHELNNPINNIMLTAHMLLEDYKDLKEEDRLDMVNDLVNESERARKIVRNLLDFARESNMEMQPIRVEEIIEETLQLASNQIKLSKVKVFKDIDQNLPPIHGDRQQLTQVCLNIVLNALDAMPKGGNLNVSIRMTKGRDYVSAKFTDTGTGIPENVLANVFDPFFTTKPGAKGTGLGLSVSLGIIKQHGGDIEVSSEMGKGTTFTILLPLAQVPAEIKDKQSDQ